MATKKKSKKKQAKKKAAPRNKAPRKKLAKKKVVRKKASPKKKKKMPAPRRTTRSKSQRSSTLAFPRGVNRTGSAGQSGDLQGLSGVEDVDSESVDELIEEGNAFEADVVKGVEDAGDNDEREVHTHEVPEDDVPEEYLDND